MRLSPVARILLRLRSGEVVWREIREERLPKGGKKLSFGSSSLFGFGLFLVAFFYATFKAEFSPESKVARWYRNVATHPAKWLSPKQEIPNLDRTVIAK
ncbi:hypothetical protein AB6A40_007709 [Gnathostoma spinigerum]|uniref:Uncharacterized protein n=1 Tax=Gnathostoma spinigerum TaxID=75299 RepID=A0ABD6EXL1_9BILA